MMNWKQLNETYPNAFLEWVNETIQFNENEVVSLEFSEIFGFLKGLNSDGGDEFTCYELTNKDLYSIPHYFDTLGIEIEATKYSCRVIDREKISTWFLGSFPNRLEALKAGVEKAFEIREEQLNIEK